jgi:hypothetical protein
MIVTHLHNNIVSFVNEKNNLYTSDNELLCAILFTD